MLDSAALRDSSGAAAIAMLRTAVVRAATGGASRGDAIELQLRQVPVRAVRAALGAAGPRFRWVDSTASRGVALSLAAAPGPVPATDVRAASGADGRLALRDAGGLLDSVRGEPGAAFGWRIAGDARGLRAEAAGAVAQATAANATPVKRLFVYGEPGWESKFVVAALEELGWSVDGTFRLSPAGRVVAGAPSRLDTARYAAVVVVDSTAVDGNALASFVSQGGGVVLGGDALRLQSLAAIRPATATALRGGVAGALLTEAPRRGLDAWELRPVRGATVLQEDRGDHAHADPAVVARRVGEGRVVATAYRESWRWRMQGTDDGLAEHRSWWRDVLSAALSAALSAPMASSEVPGGLEHWPGDAAPYADLVARAGAPVAASLRSPESGSTTSPISWPLWLAGVAMMALLLEWSSRRWRGLR